MRRAIPAGGAEMGQRSPRVLEKKRSSGSGSTGPGSAGRAVPHIIALATDPNHWRPSIGVAGQDVSGHQGNVDWQSQWNQGSRWAYVKASEGNYHVNPNFAQQYNGSRSIGMVRGAYHFAIPNWSSGADQARYFVANGGGWSADGWTLPPVLDIEYNPYEGRTDLGYKTGNTCYDLSHEQMRSWISEFGNTVRSLTGRPPVIYSTTDWWTRCTGNASGYGDYPLWIAAYPYQPSNSPGTLPASWRQFSMWQYSSTGPFAGDSNIWNGDYASLQRFAGAKLPTGSFDELSVTRSGPDVFLRARGWSVDLNNAPAANETHVYVTGPNGTTRGYPWKADTSRPDVDQVFGYGAWHGFDGQIDITASGTYEVCAYSIGTFGNTPLGCKSVMAAGVEAPTGHFDSIVQVRSADKVTLQLRGWAVDLADSSASTFADTYITAPDGSTTGLRMTANASRPDVHSVTGWGANHGFDSQVPVSSPGTYTACTYAIGKNSNRPLGCKSVFVHESPAPMGSFDEVKLTTAPNAANVRVRGWALDPSNPAQSIPVKVTVSYKDDRGVVGPTTALTADLIRPDVNAALNTVGDHGFEASISIKVAGTYEVCVGAVGVAPLSAGPTGLGCKDVSAPATPPTMGYLDSVSVQNASGSASIRTTGWTLDPAFPATSIPVHVYVTYPDGSTRGFPFTANLPRPDVNTALNTVGDHGYITSIPVSSRGRYTVCTYGVAVSVLSSNNSQLGCRTLSY